MVKTVLARWFDLLENPTPAEFARENGISQSYLSLIMAGKREPSLELAARIEKGTRGAVPATSMVVKREAAE